jgi:hypothetical protein
METKERYLQFPLFLIREMLVNKEDTINKILMYGIYKYSTKFSYSVEDASKNLMYYYYRKKRELTGFLSKEIERFINSDLLVLDEDYNGFQGTEFEPVFELEQLETIFETETEFLNRVIEFYQMQLSYNSLGISGNIEQSLKIGKEIEKQIQAGEPQPMISKSLLFDFRDKEKSEFDLIQLVAYIAIKSILGKKQYAKTNKNHIVSRMFGYPSIKHLPDKQKPGLKELIEKYSCRYHIDKVLLNLELNWKIITYSNNIRGMYVAMENKISIDALALIAETKKQTAKVEALKQQKKEATQKALMQLKINNSLNKDKL